MRPSKNTSEIRDINRTIRLIRRCLKMVRAKVFESIGGSSSKSKFRKPKYRVWRFDKVEANSDEFWTMVRESIEHFKELYADRDPDLQKPTADLIANFLKNWQFFDETNIKMAFIRWSGALTMNARNIGGGRS